MYSLAMLGMVEGNGHPYSWSAIFNGYDTQTMAACPYPVIPQYLSKVPKHELRIPNAMVTHIWTDNPEDAVHVAQASRIPNVLSCPHDAIGEVDAVIISTDIGHEHLSRAMPFIEAGLPVFIDKPLTDNLEDLCVFSKLIRQGAKILSSSCMRFAKEFQPYHRTGSFSGPIRYGSMTTPKSWERYGIHALEGIYPIIGSGFYSVRNTGSAHRNILHLKHEKDIDVTIAAIQELYGGFGALQLIGPNDCVQIKFQDTYYAFRKQLESFVNYLDTGILPIPYEETEEMMKVIIAGILSREHNGKEIFLSDLIV